MNPERVNYNAFNDPDPQDLKVNESIKLDNNKSRFANKGPSPSQNKARLDEQIKTYQENEKDIAARISTASREYLKATKDLTLPQNKSELAKQNEKDVIRELIDIASILNSDQSQPEAIGATGLINLLLKINLDQRDYINELRYKIFLLEKTNSIVDKK